MTSLLTKSEKRDKIKNNRDKMGSSARSFYQLMAIRSNRLQKEKLSTVFAEPSGRL